MNPGIKYEGQDARRSFWRYFSYVKKCEHEASVQTFREEFRQDIGRRYVGWGHFAFTTLTCVAVIAFALSRVRSPSWLELLVVPAGFLIANLVEYLGHKGPMHHPRKGLRLIHTRHTVQHHHFFTRGSMSCEIPRDFKIMLFPPSLLLFFFGGIAAPLGLLFYLALSPNSGWLFAATGVGYYLTYEWLHFAYHLPDDSVVGRLRLVRVLRAHHAHHHDLALMGRYNFNITFPIFDAVFGTTYRGEQTTKE